MKRYLIKKKIILNRLTRQSQASFWALPGDEIQVEGSNLYWVNPETKEIVETIDYPQYILCNEGNYENAVEELLP